MILSKKEAGELAKELKDMNERRLEIIRMLRNVDNVNALNNAAKESNLPRFVTKLFHFPGDLTLPMMSKVLKKFSA